MDLFTKVNAVNGCSKRLFIFHTVCDYASNQARKLGIEGSSSVTLSVDDKTVVFTQSTGDIKCLITDSGTWDFYNKHGTGVSLDDFEGDYTEGIVTGILTKEGWLLVSLDGSVFMYGCTMSYTGIINILPRECFSEYIKTVCYESCREKNTEVIIQFSNDRQITVSKAIVMSLMNRKFHNKKKIVVPISDIIVDAQANSYVV